MMIIVSPAKTMKRECIHEVQDVPMLLAESKVILNVLETLSVSDIMKMMKIKEPLAQMTKNRFLEMRFDKLGTCAIDAYDGLQFKALHKKAYGKQEMDYLQKHLRIISGFYGILRPFDSVYPYRLEMQAKLAIDDTRDVTSFWNTKIADVLIQALKSEEEPYIINLASKEYEKVILPYLRKQTIDINFYIRKDGQLKMESTQVKMARGQMICYLCEHHINTRSGVKGFDYDGYCYSEEASNEHRFCFVKGG